MGRKIQRRRAWRWPRVASITTTSTTAAATTVCSTRAPPNGASTASGTTAPATTMRWSTAGSRNTSHTARRAIPAGQRITPCGPGSRADEDPAALVAADEGVGRRVLDAVDLGGRKAEVAAAAPPTHQWCRPDSSVLGPELLVEGSQLRRQAARRSRPLGLRGGQVGVDGGLELGHRAPQAGALGVEPPTLGPEVGDLLVERLPLGHRLQHLVLEHRPPPLQGVDVGRQRLELARDGDGARVHAALELADLRLDGGKLVLQASLPAVDGVEALAGLAEGGLEGDEGLLDGEKLGRLGQGGAPVPEPVGRGAVVLQLQRLVEDRQGAARGRRGRLGTVTTVGTGMFGTVTIGGDTGG